MDFRVPVGRKRFYQTDSSYYTVPDSTLLYTILYIVLGAGAVIFILIILKLCHSSFLENHHEECPCVACRVKEQQHPQSIELRTIAPKREISPFLPPSTVTNVNETRPLASTSSSTSSSINYYSESPGFRKKEESPNTRPNIPTKSNYRKSKHFTKSYIDWTAVDVLRPIQEHESSSPKRNKKSDVSM